MLFGAPWQSLPEYYEPDDYKGDVFYAAPSYLPHTVYCWKAHHCKNQKTFVFKAIHRCQIDNLTEELRLMQQLKNINQPNLVKVYDVIYTKGSDWVFYQMEYCEGESLRYYLKGEPLDNDRCVEIIKGILKGLACLHTNGLIHRDLKPDNIFFLKDGTPKIGDYGLVKSRKWLTHISTAGTRDYMAPEMKHNAPPKLAEKRGYRSDIFSVGIMFREMITGESPPFQDEKKLKNIPPDYKEIIIKATATNPDKRFSSAENFLKALENAIPF